MEIHIDTPFDVLMCEESDHTPEAVTEMVFRVVTAGRTAEIDEISRVYPFQTAAAAFRIVDNLIAPTAEAVVIECILADSLVLVDAVLGRCSRPYWLSIKTKRAISAITRASAPAETKIAVIKVLCRYL